MLRHSGYDGSKPVRLIGCDAASNDFAQQLSKNLDAPVLAPTKPAWTDSHGRVFTSDAEIRPDGTREPKIPPNGEWETHHPDGSKSKASDDGFAPGTRDNDKDLDPTDAQDRAASPSNGQDDYDPPPRRGRIDEASPDFDEKFVDYDRPGHTDPDNPHFTRDPNPPDDLGSPRDVDAPPRDRVRDAPGPPRALEDVPTVPAPLRDHTMPPDHTSLPPNTQFNVNNPNGTKTTFFTDGNGDVKWVEATAGKKTGSNDDMHGFNPDLDYPLMGDVQYRVNDQWDFHTNERGQTDAVTGTPSYGKSDSNYRDDSGQYSAQGRAGGEGKAAYATDPDYDKVKWAGGHVVANEAGGPGEYINMFGQMNASNSGHNKDGFLNESTWRAQETELAKFASHPNQEIANYQVQMTRREDGLPETVTMRWTEVTKNPDGSVTREIFEKEFVNVPENTNYGPKTPYKR